MNQVLQMDGEGPFDDLEGNAAFTRLINKVIAQSGITLASNKSGTVTVNGVTPVTVAAPGFLAGSVVQFSLKTVGGTVGAIPHLATATPGTGFTVVGTASDSSVYNWAIIDTE